MSVDETNCVRLLKMASDGDAETQSEKTLDLATLVTSFPKPFNSHLFQSSAISQATRSARCAHAVSPVFGIISTKSGHRGQPTTRHSRC